MKYRIEDFTFEEDFVVGAVCMECGYYTDDENEFDEDCPKCCGTLISETSHEDCRCAICGWVFDTWDDVYRHDKNGDIMICEDCYEDLEDEE